MRHAASVEEHQRLLGPYNGPDDDAAKKVDTQRLFRKIGARLLPLFFCMVVMCYLDRTSLAFAAVQLNSQLGFTPQVYGVGSGLFFLTYSLLQVPSNLLLQRLGGPAWLACIMLVWGAVATCFAGLKTVPQLYALRLLLGAAEAGAFPGMWFMLTKFFPGDQVTFPFAVVESGISLSHVVAAPLAAACLSLDGAGGLAGWRWLFLLEGLPTMVLGVAMYMLLPAGPEHARFLTPEERRSLVQRVALHSRHSGHGHIPHTSSFASFAPEPGTGPAGSSGHDASHDAGPGGKAAPSSLTLLRLAASNKYVWYMGFSKFLRDIASFGIIFWAPTLVNALLHDHRTGVAAAAASLLPGGSSSIRNIAAEGGSAGRSLLGGAIPNMHSSSNGVGAVLLTSVPFGLASAFALWLAHHSQRTNERFLHIALPCIVSGTVFCLFPAAAARSALLAFVVLCVGVIGVYSSSGTSLSLVSELAAGPGLVVALPLFNSIGTMGGCVGPALVGWLVQASAAAAGKGGVGRSGSSDFGASATLMGITLAASGCMVLALGAALGRLGPRGSGPGGGLPKHGAASASGGDLRGAGGNSGSYSPLSHHASRGGGGLGDGSA